MSPAPIGTSTAASRPKRLYWRVHALLNWALGLSSLSLVAAYYALSGEVAVVGLALGLCTLATGELARRH